MKEVHPFDAKRREISRVKKWLKKKKKEDHRYSLYHSSKSRAYEKNITHTIKIADIVIPEVCPIYDVPLDRYGPLDWTPSVDKIIPALGYVPGNVWVISNRANRHKNDMSITELEQLYLAVRKKIDDENIATTVPES